MIDKQKKILKINIKTLILILYCFSLAMGIFKNSTFSHFRVFSVLSLLAIVVMVIISLLYIRFTFSQFLFFLIGMLIVSKGIINYYNSFEPYFYIVVLFFCMGNISPKKILKYAEFTMVGCVIIILFSSLFHIIPDTVVYRAGIARHSLGTNYPLTLGSYIFFLCASFYVLYTGKSAKSNFILGIIFIIVSWFLNKITGARNFSLGIVAIAVFLICNNALSKICKKINMTILTVITFILSIISIFITNIIPYYSSLYQSLNLLLSGRLDMQYELFKFYTPKLFGQYIYQITGSNSLFYFFIDNSYARLLFVAGILFTIYYFCTLGNLFYKLINLNLQKLFLVFIVIMITGIVQGTAISPEANIFLPLMCVRGELLKKDFIRETNESNN